MCSPPIAAFKSAKWMPRFTVLNEINDWRKLWVIFIVRHIWHDSRSLLQLSPAFTVTPLTWIIIHMPGLIGYGKIKSTSTDIIVRQKVQQNVRYSLFNKTVFSFANDIFWVLWAVKNQICIYKGLQLHGVLNRTILYSGRFYISYRRLLILT